MTFMCGLLRKTAAKKAIKSMEIDKGAGSSKDEPPTITNIYREVLDKAGRPVKAKGYWNVMKETRQRLQSAASSSSSSSKAESTGLHNLSQGDDGLSRERLVLLEKKDLVELCEKKGLKLSLRALKLVFTLFWRRFEEV